MKKTILFFILLWSVNCSAQGTWFQLQSGLSGGDPLTVAYALCADTVNNVLYVGGGFDSAGGIYQQGISEWDGTKWDSLPNNGFTQVDALVMYSGNLCAGDGYSDYVWLFNGTTWSHLPEFNGSVSALCLYKDTLYAAGLFTQSGTTILNHIAKWNGSQWLPLGSGITNSFLEVNTMIVYHDTLFVGGYFSEVASLAAYSIAKWDGAHWSTVGDNGATLYTTGQYRIPAYVQSFETFQGILYVGGCYDSVGGMSITNGLAEWNGTRWDSMSHPDLEQYEECDSYGALKSFDGYLFVYGNYFGGGEFIDKWNGLTISTVDSGVNEQIVSLATLNGSLYVGGAFDTVGKTIPANFIARWKPDTPLILQAVSPSPICSGNSDTLIITGAINYTWSPSMGLSATTGNTIIANPTVTTTYTVIGTNLNGDSGDTAIVVTINPNPTIYAIPNIASYCEGNSTVLTAAGGATYYWSPSNGLNATTGETITANPTVSTIYTLTGIDSNGCSGTGTVTVTVNPNPTVTLNTPSLICMGDSTTLTSSGGTTYTWSPSTGLNTTTGNTIIANPATTTTYIVTSTDSLGCSTTDSVVVIVMPSPNQPIINQYGDTLVSSSELDNQWYHNDTLLVGDTSQYIIISTLGWYRVNVTYSNGCGSASDSIDIDSLSGINLLTINTEQLTISPNPFSQQATLQFSQPITNNAQLMLYDLIGMQVENYVIPNGAKNLIIKRNNLPAGMYFYKVSGNGMPPLAGKVVTE